MVAFLLFFIYGAREVYGDYREVIKDNDFSNSTTRIRLNLGAHLTIVAANEGHIENRGGAVFAIRGACRLYFPVC